MECYSAFEGNSAICDNIEAGGHFTKLKKSEEDKYSCLTYIWNLK